MAGVKLCSAVDPQIIKTMLGNGFSDASTTENITDDNFYFLKYIISSSQTSIDTIWEIRVNWEKNIICYLSRLVKTLILYKNNDCVKKMISRRIKIV